ncbi:MAG: HEAT repeat domain-containing protein [Cystobacterineae bacterium]|nr:HEAT repeat domain-containing protein [Cystobacterineae bacterium]
MHAETNPEVLAALIDAFSSFAKTEGLPLVAPHADSPHPKLRLAAIKALIRMDAHAAMPQLLAALEDTDANVRRRATLWLAGLSPEESLRLGSIALEDFNPDVRAVAVYVLSISQLQAAQPKLLQALQDSNLKVRNAAAKALSQSSQTDWSSLPALEQAQRQRALRRLKYPHSTLPAVPTLPAPAPPCPPMAQPAPTPPVETPPLAPPILPQNHEALSAELLSALRSSLRGKTQEELASLIQASPQNLAASLLALELQGQVIRRGQKYFIA